jgi:dTMP kinase
MIIVIEGIDKSGKTTQTEMLRDKLPYKVATFSFPDYNTNIGREIRAFLDRRIDYHPRVRHLLLSANRWENRDKLEALAKGNDILILNRYYQSNIVYGLADNLPLEWLEMLDRGLPKADLTIVLDIDEEVMRDRVIEADLFESNIEKIRRVSRLYRELADKYQWLLVDGNRSKEEVNNDLIKIIMEHL